MSTSDLPWFRFYPSDWLGGTRGMSATEAGIYITLIANMYDRMEPLPEDYDRLARLCGTTKSALKKTIKTLIEDKKIVRIEGGFWNKKVQKEIEFREEKSNKSSSAAKKRWEKDQQNQREDDADAVQTQSERNARDMPRARVSEARSQKLEDKSSLHSDLSPPTPQTGGEDEKWIWNEGRLWFITQGLTETQIPYHLTEWLKAYPADQVRDAIATAGVSAPSDPVRFVAGRLRNGRRSNLQTFPIDRHKAKKDAERQEVERLRAERRALRSKPMEAGNVD